MPTPDATPTPPDAPSLWSKSNTELLSQFLESGTGERFITHLAALRPSLTPDATDLASVALRAQFVAGYEKALATILLLAKPTEEISDAPEAYPNLDEPPTKEEIARRDLR